MVRHWTTVAIDKCLNSEDWLAQSNSSVFWISLVTDVLRHAIWSGYVWQPCHIDGICSPQPERRLVQLSQALLVRRQTVIGLRERVLSWVSDFFTHYAEIYGTWLTLSIAIWQGIIRATFGEKTNQGTFYSSHFILRLSQTSRSAIK